MLQSIIEEQETINEELKSANEEILSSNEELQSTNEELETAKEELQSANEELTTLNDELRERNQQLSQANDDVTNLLNSVNIPILMLGSDLKIRRFTPVTEKLLNLIPTDIGRPVTDIKPSIDLPDLGRLVTETIESMMTLEREVRDQHGRWHSVRIRPYRTRDNKIEGAVLIFVDIDEHKRNVEEARKVHEFADALFELAQDATLVLDPDLKVRRVSRRFYELFRVSQGEIEGKSFWSLEGGCWNVPGLREALNRVVSTGVALENFEAALEIHRLGPPVRRLYRLNARRAPVAGAQDPVILMTLAARPTPRP